MNNPGYIDFSKRIQGVSGQWLHTINTNPKQLADFLSQLEFEVYTIDGSLITNDISLFHQVEKAFSFDPFHHPITNWGMWDEYWDEFVKNSKSTRIAIIYKDSDVLYGIDTQLFLRSIYDIYNIVLGLERMPQIPEMHHQAVLFVHGKSEGYKLIESDKFLS